MTQKQRNALYGYMFISFWIIGFVSLTLIPLVRSFTFSISDVSITGADGIITEMIGFEHYVRILTTDVNFIDALIRYLSEMILYVPIILILSMMIALMLNQNIRFRGFFRAIFFLPVIIVSGPVINELLNQGAGSIPLIERYGMIESIQDTLPSFLADPLSQLLTEMIKILWFSGVQIVLFLAGIQKLPVEVYEAAKVDGATPWETFWKITLPSLRSIMVVASIYTIVTLSTFSNNEILVRIRQLMFSADGGYGFASAMAWIYFVIIAAILIITTIVIMPKEKRVKKNRRVRHARV
jgi:ABC-type sugar transport system permease subunit